MKKVLAIALFCAGASLCAVPVAQAHETTHAAWLRVADDDSSVSTSTSTATSNDTSKDKSKPEGTVHKCLQWVRKEFTKIENGKTVRTTAAVCAVRG